MSRRPSLGQRGSHSSKRHQQHSEDQQRAPSPTRRDSSIPRLPPSLTPRGSAQDVAVSGLSESRTSNYQLSSGALIPAVSRHGTAERSDTRGASAAAAPPRKGSGVQVTTITAATQEYSSLLSDLGQAYVKVGKKGNKDVISFITKNPDVRAIPDASFLEEAKNALREGDPDYARLCIQQSLILRGYNEDRAHGSTSWQAGLLRHDEEEEDLESDIDKVFAALSLRVKESSRPAPSKAAPKASYEKQQAAPTSKSLRHAAESPNEPAQTSAGNQDLQYSVPDYPQGGIAGGFPRHSADGVLNQGAGRNRALTTNSGADGHSVGDSLLSLSALDPSYSLRHSSFFAIGRVISVVWHSAAGHNANDSRGIRASGLGKSYSGIRRMVVIQQQRGCSWCLGIHTYGNRGLAKQGLTQQDVDEHTIVHMIGQVPQYNPGEPKSKRSPIAIFPANPSQTLSRASRLCCTKVHTIEHNQVVSHVGDIRGPDLKQLKKYFMSHCPDYRT